MIQGELVKNLLYFVFYFYVLLQAQELITLPYTHFKYKPFKDFTTSSEHLGLHSKKYRCNVSITTMSYSKKFKYGVINYFRRRYTKKNVSQEYRIAPLKKRVYKIMGNDALLITGETKDKPALHKWIIILDGPHKKFAIITASASKGKMSTKVINQLVESLRWNKTRAPIHFKQLFQKHPNGRIGRLFQKRSNGLIKYMNKTIKKLRSMSPQNPDFRYVSVPSNDKKRTYMIKSKKGSKFVFSGYYGEGAISIKDKGWVYIIALSIHAEQDPTLDISLAIDNEKNLYFTGVHLCPNLVLQSSIPGKFLDIDDFIRSTPHYFSFPRMKEWAPILWDEK